MAARQAKKSETMNVETHEITKTQNKFRAQSAQIKKDMNDPEKSLFWTAKPGDSVDMNVFEALLRSQKFTINGVDSEYLVLDFKGTVFGNVKITSFPSFVLKTAENAAEILEKYDESILNQEPVGENIAFSDRPWISVKKPFVIRALFANVKGISRIVHVRDVTEEIA